MPIDKEEFENANLQSEVEESIISFLNQRKEGAFTPQEIMDGVHFHTDFSTPETAMMSTFAITDFTSILHDLARERKVTMKTIGGRLYYTIDQGAKCPKCGIEYARPRKSWKMAGRPDKKGKRLQLHIGLYNCPRHGNFRAVLAKQKI